MKSLTEEVLHYQRTGEGLSRLLYRLSCEVYAYPSRQAGFEEDDCGDFFLFARQRIPALIHNFRFTGKPFEAYMNSCLRWQLRSFMAQKSKQRRRYRVCNAPHRWEELNEAELSAAEQPAGRSAATHDEQGKEISLQLPSRKSHRRTCSGRRLVILALKGCLRLQEADIQTLAQETGYRRDLLSTAWSILRERTERRLQRLQRLRTKRNQTFFRLLCLQDELGNAAEPADIRRVTEEIELQTRRLKTIRNRIARVPLAPTNKEIAEVLSIPKGSVDSTLYYMRNLWHKGAFPQQERADAAETTESSYGSQRYA